MTHTDFFCFEHGIGYTIDDMMCPKCESEICETHDPSAFIKRIDEYIKNEMEKQMTNKDLTEQFVPQSTKAIQEESLTHFMAAIGYEPVYNEQKGLIRFNQPRFYKTGESNVSVNRAIRLHNEAGEEAFAQLIAFTPAQELRPYLRQYDNYRTLMLVAAGATKIIEQIKGSFSKRKGFQVHDHNIKFMTKRDERFYSRYIGC